MLDATSAAAARLRFDFMPSRQATLYSTIGCSMSTRNIFFLLSAFVVLAVVLGAMVMALSLAGMR